MPNPGIVGGTNDDTTVNAVPAPQVVLNVGETDAVDAPVQSFVVYW